MANLPAPLTIADPRVFVIPSTGRNGLATVASAAGPQRAWIVFRSWRGGLCSMTGREPRLEVAALDLYRSLELHVLKISAVAGRVDDGLRDLQQPCDLRDGEQAVIWDCGDD